MLVQPVNNTHGYTNDQKQRMDKDRRGEERAVQSFEPCTGRMQNKWTPAVSDPCFHFLILFHTEQKVILCV